MIELQSDKLLVSFPSLAQNPCLTIDLQRTIRIPDDGKNYPLPPGLGSFPLRHIDDFASSVQSDWLKRGGVILPMWQSEALWLNFNSRYLSDRETAYPFAVKVATGKINAVSGEAWQPGLSRAPQNYVVIPHQPWLDGYSIEKGVIRQFVAMPLGEGYTAEEQLTGQAEFGGLQIEVFPMRQEAFDRRFPVTSRLRRSTRSLYDDIQVGGSLAAAGMGLAPGGRMRQEVYEDPFGSDDWDLGQGSRCFIHLVNSTCWRRVTGQNPPTEPITARQYNRAGYPWFDYYADRTVLEGSHRLASLKSVNEMKVTKRLKGLPGNESVVIRDPVVLRAGLRPGQVRESDLG